MFISQKFYFKKMPLIFYFLNHAVVNWYKKVYLWNVFQPAVKIVISASASRFVTDCLGVT